MEELDLLANKHESDAAAELADNDLDALNDLIAPAALIEAKNDRGKPPYSLLYATQRPSDVKRPILGGQLDLMITWPPTLAQCQSTNLKTDAVSLEAACHVGEEAQAGQAKAETAFTNFRAIGTRKQAVDKLNAARKSIHGKLGEIQHNHPELGAGWADSFFRQSGGAERVTVKELDRRIAATEIELAVWKKQRDDLAAQEDAAAKAKKEVALAKKRAELSAAQKAAAELAARAAELAAEIEKDEA